MEDRVAALQMAEESITMLKNDNKTLPINLNGSKLKFLVTGPSGNSIRLQAGGWSVVWDGAKTDAEFYGHGSTIFQAIRDMATKNDHEVTYIEGTGLEDRTTWDEALSAAAKVDYVIVALGEKPYVEFTYNIKNLYVSWLFRSNLFAGGCELIMRERRFAQ
jgi:beta-glucosidase